MNKVILLISILLLLILSSCTSKIVETDISYNTIINNRDSNSKEDFHRLFSNDIKHEITIEISDTEWKKMHQDMNNYHNQYGNYKSDTYYRANMIYKDQYGTIEIDQVGFRTKGNTSRVLPQNSDGTLNSSHYKIKFDETFDNQVNTFDYQSLNNRKFFDLEELNLKYNRNYDSTYISEIFSYNLFNLVGVKAPRATLATFTLKIDHKEILLGVYNIIEPIDKEFIDKRYEEDEATGNLYKCLWQDFGPATLINNYLPKAIGIKDASINYRPSYDLKTNKEKFDFKDLKSFINNINKLNGSEFQNYIENNFEVDNFLKLLALGVLIGNPDDYRSMGNNYYLYHNTNSNKFEMIPYDYDHSLGQGWIGEPAFTNYSIGASIYDWPNNNLIWNNPVGNGTHPLVDKVLSIKKYQDKYEQYLNDYITPNNDIFNYNSFLEQYYRYKNLYNIDAMTSKQNYVFGERNSRWYFEQKIKDIKDQLNYYKNNPDKRGIS
ncbi:MAG: hypothetical protein K0Q49_2375 [Haloplasmataceae bacterium]|nr:hypothetical protein [Haloplasmataceae bacterium]